MRERYRRSLEARAPEWPASRAVLEVLAAAPARTVEIAERAHYSRSAVKVALWSLQRRGLVEKAAGWRWRTTDKHVLR